MSCSAGLRGQTTTPDRPDPAEVRAGLAAAEEAHRLAYQAAKFGESIAAARRGLALGERSGSLRDQVPFLRHLAYDHWLMGDNDSALDHAQRVLEQAEKLDDNRLRSQAHRYLAIIYQTLGDADRLRSHAELALRFGNLAGDAEVRIFALEAVGLGELKAGRHDPAARAFTECRDYWQRLGSRWNAANSLANLADVADARTDLTGALKLYEEILAIRTDVKDRRGQVRAVGAIASLLRRLGRADEAVARLAAVRPLAESVGGHRILAEYYRALAEGQEARRDFSGALATERLAIAEQEALTSERARLRAGELEARLDLLQKQQALDQLRSTLAVHDARLRGAAADLAQVRSFRISVVYGLGVCLAVVAGGWLVLRYRTRFKRNHATLANALNPPPAGETRGDGPSTSS